MKNKNSYTYLISAWFSGKEKHLACRFVNSLFLTLALLFIYPVTHAQTMSISTATVTVTPQVGTAVDLSQNPGSSAGASPLGFLLPELTTLQMNALPASAPAGLLIFNTDVQCYEIYSGSNNVWTPFWCLCTTVPTVTAGATSNNVCSGSTIYLTATGAATTYSWTGPNGFTSSLQNPTIANATLAASGTYTVTASDGCGSSTPSTVTISVSAGTAITAGVVASPICSSSTINLTCTSGGVGATYSWTGPNGFTSSSQNPSISNSTPAATGTYTVICNEGSCSESSTVSVVVNATPPAPIAPIYQIDPLTNATYVDPCGKTCIAIGQSMEYTVTKTTGVTYTWTVPNGTITSGQGTNTIYVTWTGAGTNEITVYETENGCNGPTIDLFVTVTSTCSCTYSGCGAVGTFTVPSGMTQVSLSVSGAQGGGTYIGMNGYGAQSESDGSATYGAKVTCTYTTTGGTVLHCYGGCKGGNGTSSAAGAGGVGGNSDETGGNGSYWAGVASNSFAASDFLSSSGGGGGASDIRVGGTAHANIIVCGGGGGGDYVHWDWGCVDCQTGSGNGGCSDGGSIGAFIENNDYTTGYMYAGSGTGCGGGPNGSAGGTDKYGLGSAEGGGGGTTTTAGAGGTVTDQKSLDLTGCTPTADTHCAGTAGSSGSNGNGGNAGKEGFYTEDGTCEYGVGGGGGGGYFGGGGGSGGGGGGGSSYAGAGTSAVGYTSCSQTGNGTIIITW